MTIKCILFCRYSIAEVRTVQRITRYILPSLLVISARKTLQYGTKSVNINLTWLFRTGLCSKLCNYYWLYNIWNLYDWSLYKKFKLMFVDVKRLNGIVLYININWKLYFFHTVMFIAMKNYNDIRMFFYFKGFVYVCCLCRFGRVKFVQID